MTYKQIINRMKDIDEEIDRLADKAEQRDGLTPDQKTNWAELKAEFDELDGQRERLEREDDRMKVKRAMVAAKVGAGGVRTENGSGDLDSDPLGEPDSVEDKRFKNPWDLSEVRGGLTLEARTHEYRARALTAIEQMSGANDAVRKVSTRFVEDDDPEDGRLSALVLATSSPTYVRAFAKLFKSNNDIATLSDDERRAVASVRAASLTDSAGGYLIPFQLDPTVVLTAAGSRNQVRQISRVVNATGDVWSGITSAGVTGSWDAEAAEVSDDAPTFAQPQIANWKMNIFVPASLEVYEDADNLAGQVGRMIAFEKDRLESVAFVIGNGTSEPTGIVTALTGTASVVNSATTDTFAVADVYALDGALPARFRANASWLAHRLIYNLVRRFDTSGGAALWTQLQSDVPGTLLGRPAYEAESMDGTITALAANPVAILGDFENYVITDRIGTQLQFIPFLMGANRRPTGQVGWYAHARVGADSILDNAFRMLDVT